MWALRDISVETRARLDPHSPRSPASPSIDTMASARPARRCRAIRASHSHPAAATRGSRRRRTRLPAAQRRGVEANKAERLGPDTGHGHQQAGDRDARAAPHIQPLNSSATRSRLPAGSTHPLWPFARHEERTRRPSSREARAAAWTSRSPPFSGVIRPARAPHGLTTAGHGSSNSLNRPEKSGRTRFACGTP